MRNYNPVLRLEGRAMRAADLITTARRNLGDDSLTTVEQAILALHGHGVADDVTGKVEAPCGHVIRVDRWITRTDDRGFTETKDYASPEDAARVFAEYEDEYADWQSESLAERLADPDILGSAEYREIYDLAISAESPEAAATIVRQFIIHANDILKALGEDYTILEIRRLQGSNESYALGVAEPFSERSLWVDTNIDGILASGAREAIAEGMVVKELEVTTDGP